MLLLGRKRTAKELEDVVVKLKVQEVVRSEEVKLLGVLADEGLTWSDHIETVHRKCFGGLANLRRHPTGSYVKEYLRLIHCFCHIRTTAVWCGKSSTDRRCHSDSVTVNPITAAKVARKYHCQTTLLQAWHKLTCSDFQNARQ